jgi:hypothetical protein
MGADVNWNLIRRPKVLAKFDIQTNLDTAHVACLRIFPGIKPESKFTSSLSTIITPIDFNRPIRPHGPVPAKPSFHPLEIPYHHQPTVLTFIHSD